jgi:hypothetical protein
MNTVNTFRKPCANPPRTFSLGYDNAQSNMFTGRYSVHQGQRVHKHAIKSKKTVAFRAHIVENYCLLECDAFSLIETYSHYEGTCHPPLQGKDRGGCKLKNFGPIHQITCALSYQTVTVSHHADLRFSQWSL